MIAISYIPELQLIWGRITSTVSYPDTSPTGLFPDVQFVEDTSPTDTSPTDTFPTGHFPDDIFNFSDIGTSFLNQVKTALSRSPFSAIFLFAFSRLTHPGSYDAIIIFFVFYPCGNTFFRN